MQIFRTKADLQVALVALKQDAQSIALVPTMGNLHGGHLALVKQAKSDCAFVLVSIFVNPTQFGPGEDLEKYPRSFDADIAALQTLDCDAVFAPSVDEIYPGGLRLDTRVTVPALSKLHCGTLRPGHFDGVCTVVSKLFNLCQPDNAYFGEKDFQQLSIIRKLVSDLNFPIQIVAVPTKRAESGLALSSRNNYLSDTQRQQAASLYASLVRCADRLKAKKHLDFKALEQLTIQDLQNHGLRPDYVHICDPDSLMPAKTGAEDLRILAAAYLGETRLIDNIAVELTN